MATVDPVPEPSTILGQLDRIFASGKLDASERNQRFLRYIVEETLDGRAHRIKAYSIATAVFGRDGSFDPQTDPIVRVEAGRLRRALERYYLVAGQDDSVRISIPKGSYVPEFAILSVPAPAGEEPPPPPPPAFPMKAGPRPVSGPRLSRVALATGLVAVALAAGLALLWSAPSPTRYTGAAAAARAGPAVLVIPLEAQAGEDSANPDLARGMTREIIAGLARFKDLLVFGEETSFKDGDAPDPRKLTDQLNIDYVLSGTASSIAGRFRVVVSLKEARSKQYVWSNAFEGALASDGVLKVQQDVSTAVVQTLAQPYGVIFADEVREIAAKPAQQLSSYQCVLQFQLYWRRFDAGRYGGVRDCLERAIAADPAYAEAFASLALLYLDAYRFPLNDKRAIPGNAIARARQLAQRAVELSPQSARAYRALQLAYWFAHDLPHSFEAGERGLALNPNDSEMMAELGFRRCLIGEWQRGLPLVKEAFARNPALPDGYRVAVFLDDYMNGRYEEALAEANRVDLPNIVFGPVMQAMALAQLGRTVEARAAVERILAIEPAYGDKVVADLENRNVYPALIGIIAEGLRKAGLPVNGAPGLARAE